MYRTSIAALIVLLCSGVSAQTTVDELAQFNRESVMAKRCADLAEKAYAVTLCKSYTGARPAPVAMTDVGTTAKRAERLDIVILSAWGTPEDPAAEVSINDMVRVMRKGDSFQGWLLASLDPYVAQFKNSKGTLKTIPYRTSLRSMPVTLPVGLPPGAPVPMPGPAIGAAQAFPVIR